MKPQLLRGFRDYGPEEMLARQQMLNSVRAVFESFGYMPLETPALEFAELLLGKYGAEGEKLLYQFEDQGGRKVALRYDLTVPLARYVAMNPNLRFPFRRYQIAPVWRAERPQRGRFREFHQCDVDLVGVNSPQADAECILVDFAVMNALGLSEFTVCVNHRKYLDGLLESLGIRGAAVAPVLRVLDKVDKISPDDLKCKLVELGLSARAVEVLGGLSGITGTNAERMEQGLVLASGNATAALALERVRAVLNLVEVSQSSLCGGGTILFAPWVARGLDYYTGVVYETFLPPEFGVGSVMSGGRYDGLLGLFAGREIPAVGISLGLDRLVSALSGKRQSPRTVVQVLVCTLKGAEREATALAAELRAALGGIGVELYPEPARVKKQLEYANSRHIPTAVIIGPDEATRGVSAVKSLETGQQVEVPRGKVVETVRAMVLGGR